jgi:hypothetical protein
MVIRPSETENDPLGSAAPTGSMPKIHNWATQDSKQATRRVSHLGNLPIRRKSGGSFVIHAHELLMTRISVINKATLIKPRTTTVVTAKARELWRRTG